ncbi:hypothetical protein WUBG_00800 [Wuchereria bancrofti]|uniref:Uncharacterized protein n=1 Tax=Wuchereria bancrofti TaxID=6293 RepID=J9F1B5_WUCBA|nr:hypothetical protein WUBG_00800 [Wuchereria bancrofti]
MRKKERYTEDASHLSPSALLSCCGTQILIYDRVPQSQNGKRYNIKSCLTRRYRESVLSLSS